MVFVLSLSKHINDNILIQSIEKVGISVLFNSKTLSEGVLQNFMKKFSMYYAYLYYRDYHLREDLEQEFDYIKEKLRNGEL